MSGEVCLVDVVKLKIISVTWMQASSPTVIHHLLDGHPVGYDTVIPHRPQADLGAL
jgi:hypothetical protein